MEKFLGSDNIDHGHGHGKWASDGYEMTIGDYMADKLNETDGAQDKANAYFNALLKSGLMAEEATWVAGSDADTGTACGGICMDERQTERESGKLIKNKKRIKLIVRNEYFLSLEKQGKLRL